MVVKTQLCRFSGLRIYPAKGMVYVRGDGHTFHYISKKAKSYAHRGHKPVYFAWTTTYRRVHKKDQVMEVSRRKKRGGGKAAVRSIGSTSVQVLQQRRAEKPEFRQATRDAAVREIKERMKKARQDKGAKKEVVRKAPMQVMGRGGAKGMPGGPGKSGKR